MRVSLSELARRLQAGKSSVSALRDRGVIKPGPDHKYDLEESLKAIAGTSGTGGGWSVARGKLGLGERAKALLGEQTIALDSDLEARRVLMDRILSRRNLVPQILAEIGVTDPAFVHASNDIFAALVVDLAGDLAPYDWCSDDLPLLPDIDYAPIFRRLKTKLTRQIVGRADAMADAAYPAIEEALKGV